MSRPEASGVSPTTDATEGRGGRDGWRRDDWRRGGWIGLAGFVVLTFLSFFPLFSVYHPPLQDYANHLARMFVLVHPDDALLQRFWTIAWHPVPNLAMDWLVPLLTRFMPLAHAGKAFVALTILLAASGTGALQWALYRKVSPLVLLSFLFVHHFALQKGFLNFSFALGLSLWALAGWVLVSDRGVLVRLVYGVLASLLTFFAHLHGFGLFALSIGAFESSRAWLERRERALWIRPAVAALATLPAVCIYAFVSPHEPSEAPFKAGLFAKKLVFTRYVIPTLSPSWDLVTTLLLTGLLGFLLATRSIRVHRHLVPYFAFIVVAYFALPAEGIGGANADWRMIVVLPFAFLGALEPAPKPANSHTTGLWVAALVAVCTFRFIGVERLWHGADRTYRDTSKLLQRLPEGASLMTLVRGFGYDEATIERPLNNLGSFAVIERRAYVPTLFAKISQQPLQQRTIPEQPWRRGQATSAFLRKGSLPDCEVIGHFDYLLLVDRSDTAPPCGAVKIARLDDVALYRFAHSATEQSAR
ncbi:MAG TPA: hypothetical protein VLC09_22195 [Polyangiaceae bacterium]|nr:hypothetical protein [Polyangiaceae bacterium]